MSASHTCWPVGIPVDKSHERLFIYQNAISTDHGIELGNFCASHIVYRVNVCGPIERVLNLGELGDDELRRVNRHVCHGRLGRRCDMGHRRPGPSKRLLRANDKGAPRIDTWREPRWFRWRGTPDATRHFPAHPERCRRTRSGPCRG